MKSKLITFQFITNFNNFVDKFKCEREQIVILRNNAIKAIFFTSVILQEISVKKFGSHFLSVPLN